MSASDLIVFIISLIVFCASVFDAVKNRFKIINLNTKNLQLEVDRMVVAIHLEGLMKEKESKSIEQSDGFVKFLSESRDWAFEYIENVQAAIGEYKDALSSLDEQRVELSYRKLLTFLPSPDMLK
jgi:hypothetical protein